MALCGIDEAGRGPIAGSLVMAGVILHIHVKGLDDSKKLTEKRREALYEEIVKNSTYHIVSYSAAQVDELGISKCISSGLKDIMKNIESDDYLFDGNSTFGVTGLRTMIKADAEITEVSAASILAKVTHDREMLEFAKQYPKYEFEKHKGYGTKLHVNAIKEHGYCEVHRKTFRIKALEATLF
ncbi:MAG: ribonuclease HII [Campylobacterota bacterium]|nr:ribonuclease HII [Campylobacterota bacterium]